MPGILRLGRRRAEGRRWGAPRAARPPGTAPSKPPQATAKPQPSPEVLKAAKLFEEAVSHQRAGRIDEAISEYRSLLKFAPGAYPAWTNLGLLYRARKNNVEAEKC